MEWADVNTSFKSRVFCGRIMNNNDIIDPDRFLEQCFFILVQKVGEFILKYKSPVKMNSSLACEYAIKKGDITHIATIYHEAKMAPVTLNDDFTIWFRKNVRDRILTQMSEFQERDSGKALNKILYLQVNINKFDPTNSGGSSYIDLPLSIKNKKAVINVKNSDEKCFLWALVACLYPVEHHSDRTSSYPQILNDPFNLSDIHFPTPLADIQKFEKQNEISVNVYGIDIYDESIVGPLHYTKNKKNKHVNLLYWNQGEKRHYAWIKSLSRLLSSQISKNLHTKWICDKCLQYFGTEELLKCHENDCTEAIRIIMPNDKTKWLQFENFTRKERHPFIIYADFECLTVPIDSCQPDPVSSYTNAYQHHVPCAVGYQVVCSYDDTLSFYESYRGPNVSAWFLKRLKSVVDMINIFYKNIAGIEMTPDDWIDYDTATVCHICQKPFSSDEIEGKDKKVRDHCHLSGKYRGAAHCSCNLNYKQPRHIPVFFHNLSGYDSHLLVRELGVDQDPITVLPCNGERFISFSKKIGDISLRFLDSYRFMGSSLDKLISYLQPNSFKLMNKHFPDKLKFELMRRKGVFPYDYVKSWDNLEETVLPEQNSFYSKLRNENIDDTDYCHAQTIWKTFNHATLGDYMELYLQTDVLLLADVFENFRDVCLKSYALDPAHYFTTPGLAWDVMLKMTGITLELLTDIDMLLFFERGIRGGISQCCNRYAHANNPYMNSSYDPKNVDTYLMYFDACNLYGWAMTQSLPYGSFKWLTTDEIKILDNQPYSVTFLKSKFLDNCL